MANPEIVKQILEELDNKLKIRLTDEDPCEGCANKVDDNYGRFCDIACGKHSTYVIKQEAYKAQLKKVVEFLNRKTIELAPGGHRRIIISFEDWQALLDEVND